MATTKYEVAAASTLLTTELNSLAAAAKSALGTEYDNATNLYIEGIFEIYVASFGTAPVDGETIDLYLVPCADGTNYADGSNSVINVSHFAGSFVMRNVATAQRAVLRDAVKLPPLKFKVQIVNNTSYAMAASANTVKMIPVRYQSA